MSTSTKTNWRITGECLGGCNCAWGCPCQFNALPTHGRCEFLDGLEIREGYFGSTRLDGVRFAMIYWWPGRPGAEKGAVTAGHPGQDHSGA